MLASPVEPVNQNVDPNVGVIFPFGNLIMNRLQFRIVNQIIQLVIVNAPVKPMKYAVYLPTDCKNILAIIQAENADHNKIWQYHPAVRYSRPHLKPSPSMDK